MKNIAQHTFHIPVMGLGFTIDTPLKVARFGISSALSLADDELIEQMRQHYAQAHGHAYEVIPAEAEDARARRITAYLDLLGQLVSEQTAVLREEDFEPGNEIVKYFELLPEASPMKQDYLRMLAGEGEARKSLEARLRACIEAGAIDVNIMTKVDKTNYGKDGEPLPPEYSDALAALRGFANSRLHASVILSAGLNPRLFAYFEAFDSFFPDEAGHLAKKVVLKVSDYRSALVQGKLLAKKGIWVSEFRIESGLNCGGHAFVNDGMLLGPIMESFKANRQALYAELKALCDDALRGKGRVAFPDLPVQRITVQGGIGHADEDRFLADYYELDGTGWGSPFLLVPEVTSLDAETLQSLANANPDDFYLSNASPLGVPFHNFKPSSAEQQRKDRIERNRPGSPCHKKYLTFNTEYTDRPICTASRQYQHLKLKEAQAKYGTGDEYRDAAARIMEKDCLCDGLAAPAVAKNHIKTKYKLKATTVCPGPNLAYFSRISTLQEMVSHIYGRADVLNSLFRPNLFVNELRLYMDYFGKEIDLRKRGLSERKDSYFRVFQENLKNGIQYYRDMVPRMKDYVHLQLDNMIASLAEAEQALTELAAVKEEVQPAWEVAR